MFLAVIIQKILKEPLKLLDKSLLKYHTIQTAGNVFEFRLPDALVCPKMGMQKSGK